MDAISTLSAMYEQQAAQAVAILALKQANAVQESSLALLEDAVLVAEQVQQAGLGDHIDVQA